MTVNIGRSTIFGNPVRMRQRCPVCGGQHDDAGSTAPCYRHYLTARLSGEPTERSWAEGVARSIRGMPVQGGFREAVKALHGQVLQCPGCGVGASTCHGRILEEAIARLQQG
jgi:hypothetical protein